jgi:hypothetical protein
MMRELGDVPAPVRTTSPGQAHRARNQRLVRAEYPRGFQGAGVVAQIVSLKQSMLKRTETTPLRSALRVRLKAPPGPWAEWGSGGWPGLAKPRLATECAVAQVAEVIKRRAFGTVRNTRRRGWTAAVKLTPNQPVIAEGARNRFRRPAYQSVKYADARLEGGRDGETGGEPRAGIALLRRCHPARPVERN